MVESLKKLTVSYGAFSCTLEGFDDPFPVMKQVVDYFQALADRDPGFGAHPERPDAEYLRNLALQSAGVDDVQAEVHEGGVILRQTSEAASDFEGMDVVEETVIVTPTAFLPKTDETDETDAISEDVIEEIDTASEEEIPLDDVAESEDFADAWPEPEYEEYEEEEGHELETPDLAEASEVAELIDADPLPEVAASNLAAVDEMAALHADMERFDAEPVVDTAPTAAELPDILKTDRETADDTAPAFEDFPSVSDEDLAATEREMTEMALDTGDAPGSEIIDVEDEPEVIETAEEPKEKSGLVSKLPNWAAGLIRPSAGNDMNVDLGVVDLGIDESESETEAADVELNGTTASDGLDPEDAALERLLKVTESRRIEPDATSEADALSEIREGILGMNPHSEPAEGESAVESPGFENAFETADALDATNSADDTADVSEPDEAGLELSVSDDDASEMNEEEAAPAEDDAVMEDEHQIDEEAHTAAISSDVPDAETASASLTLEKPVKVLEPLQLTTAFKVSDVVAEEVASEELSAEETSSDFGTAESDELVLSSEEAEDEEEAAQERGAFRLVHDRAPSDDEAETADLTGGAEGIADDDLSLAIFASKVGAASLPELLEASAAYTTIVAGQTRFSRRSIMGMVDEMNTERNFSQEARIKSFGKLIRSGTILRVEDGQFSISRSAKFDYEMKIGA